MSFKKNGHFKDIRRSKVFKDLLPIEVASEDLQYYKLLECTSNGYVTPFTQIPVKIDEEIKSDKPIAADDYYNFSDSIFINHGIHMIDSLENALFFKSLYTTIHIKIVKCIIPKGTRYLKSNVNCEIISEKVIYKNE